MGVGSELRLAREHRGLSLDQISNLTKIKPSTLLAIENNEFARLPGGIFTRGFLKAYAREVALDPLEIVRHYTAEFEKPLDAQPAGVERPQAERVVRSAEQDGDGSIERLAWPLAEDSQAVWTIAAVVVLALVLSLPFFPRRQASPSERVEPARTSDAAAATDRAPTSPDARVRAEAATSGTSAAVAAPPDGALHVDLQPSGLCWIAATADGKQVAYRLMHAGERQVIDARSQLVLRVGNPAALTFSINGAAVRRIGDPGEPTTLRITPQNYRNLLAQ